jgi:L-alanine-DL-glutamate epimerase-like enolase superfamily enzyme
MRVVNLDTLPFSVPLGPPPGGSAHPLGAGFLTYCLVRAETDDGLVGWGEISDGWGCEYAGVAGAIVREALARFVIGQDPAQTPILVQRMFAWLRRRQGTVWLIAQAVSGVELALWDLVGKAAGQPVNALLGPALRDRVPVYASGNFLSQGDAEVHATFFEPALARGVNAVKVRLGPNWEVELETLAELRRLLGPKISVGIDGNEAFTPKTGGRIAERLGALGVWFFEEPTPRTDPQGLAWLVARSPVPIAYGEHVHRVDGFLELADQRLADVWQPDATVCGGLMEARAIGALAAARGIPISPHSATTPLGLAANLHAAALAPTLSALEYSAASVRQLARLFSNGECLNQEALVDGALAVPTAPGLGVEPRVAELREAFPFEAPWPLDTLPALYTGSV